MRACAGLPNTSLHRHHDVTPLRGAGGPRRDGARYAAPSALCADAVYACHLLLTWSTRSRRDTADEMTGPPPCDVHTDQGSCEEMHCAWDGSVCADPPPCDTHTDQGSCAADMHCAWDGSACTETTGPPPICGDPYGDGNPFDCGENTLLPDTPCDRATGCTAETCCTPPQTGGAHTPLLSASLSRRWTLTAISLSLRTHRVRLRWGVVRLL